MYQTAIINYIIKFTDPFILTATLRLNSLPALFLFGNVAFLYPGQIFAFVLSGLR